MAMRSLRIFAVAPSDKVTFWAEKLACVCEVTPDAEPFKTRPSFPLGARVSVPELVAISCAPSKSMSPSMETLPPNRTSPALV